MKMIHRVLAVGAIAAVAATALTLSSGRPVAAAESETKKPIQSADMGGGVPPPAVGALGFAWPRIGAAFSLDGAPMIYIPAGPFMMGSSPMSRDAAPDEKPAHKITLKAYYIDRYEVTEAQYRLFLADVAQNGHGGCDRSEPASKDHTPSAETWAGDAPGSRQPVVGVDWYDAAAYCAWAGKRLPTEAEWEKAARGSDERTWPWGDKWDRARTNSWETGRKSRTPVGTYETGASPAGVEDLAGNVWEWVRDWYAPKFYFDSPKQDPGGPATGTARVVRGGSYLSNPSGVRSTVRQGNDPIGRYSNFGFRCAQSAAAE